MKRSTLGIVSVFGRITAICFGIAWFMVGVSEAIAGVQCALENESDEHAT